MLSKPKGTLRLFLSNSGEMQQVFVNRRQGSLDWRVIVHVNWLSVMIRKCGQLNIAVRNVNLIIDLNKKSISYDDGCLKLDTCTFFIFLFPNVKKPWDYILFSLLAIMLGRWCPWHHQSTYVPLLSVLIVPLLSVLIDDQKWGHVCREPLSTDYCQPLEKSTCLAEITHHQKLQFRVLQSEVHYIMRNSGSNSWLAKSELDIV